MRVIIISVFVLNFVFAGNFIFNGNFEDSLNYWNCYAQGETYTIHTDKMYEIEDPDSEVYVGRLDRFITAISQTCYIPNFNLNLSFKAKVVARCADTSHPAPAVASIIISYLDIDENILGETRLLNYCDTLYWTPSPKLHLIELSDTNWIADTINIAEELQNLPGVNPAEIYKLRITLLGQSYGC
ncbi:MAG: hypothetical protein ABIL69_00850 [candidate division WOR-3 bacterium]